MNKYERAIQKAREAMNKIDEATKLLVEAKEQAGYNDRGCQILNAYCIPYLQAVAGHDECMITMGSVQDAIEYWAEQMEDE